jgi:hypothetical protein
MEIIYACCCGLDVHAKTVVACLIKSGKKQIRTFSTMRWSSFSGHDALAA